MPEYRITVDLSNPGQYFACCGLFEIAELAIPGGEAGFDTDGPAFILHSEADLPPLELVLESPESFDDKPYDATLEPLKVTSNGHALTLNWWLNETQTKKSQLKTWGGQQTPRRVFSELLRILDNSVSFDALFK